MKIVGLEEFRALPEGAVFAKFQPDVFDDLCIKGETWDVDFLYSSLTDDIECDSSTERDELLDLARLEGRSIKMAFDQEGRDGCFDDDQLFAVWEHSDVVGLMFKLNESLSRAYS